ncbi:uncharacterized protein LOC135289049 [Passer domesticus]|uniref:uncharacterized protein LOC135289049 n=1 Tax=Passer domesticus TaxID=48849 RepID=UPI0030FE1D2D
MPEWGGVCPATWSVVTVPTAPRKGPVCPGRPIPSCSDRAGCAGHRRCYRGLPPALLSPSLWEPPRNPVQPRIGRQRGGSPDTANSGGTLSRAPRVLTAARLVAFAAEETLGTSKKPGIEKRQWGKIRSFTSSFYDSKKSSLLNFTALGPSPPFLLTQKQKKKACWKARLSQGFAPTAGKKLLGSCSKARCLHRDKHTRDPQWPRPQSWEQALEHREHPSRWRQQTEKVPSLSVIRTSVSAHPDEKWNCCGGQPASLIRQKRAGWTDVSSPRQIGQRPAASGGFLQDLVRGLPHLHTSSDVTSLLLPAVFRCYVSGDSKGTIELISNHQQDTSKILSQMLQKASHGKKPKFLFYYTHLCQQPLL